MIKGLIVLENNSEQIKRPFLCRASRFFFAIYVITLYVFVIKKETLVYSQLAFLAFAGCTALYVLLRGKLYFGRPVLWGYLTCAWMFASIIWASSRYIATDRAWTMWQLFALFFLVYNLFYTEKDGCEFFLKVLYIAGICLCIYSVHIYGAKGIIDAMLTEGTRLGSEVSQANVFGMQNATTTVLAFYYLYNKKKHRLFHAIIMCASFIIAMSSGSRKALLMACTGILFLVYKKYGIKYLYKVVATVLALAFAFSVIIQLPLFETVRTRMEQGINAVEGKDGGDSSAEKRLHYIDKGWNLFKDKWAIGYGISNFGYVSRTGTYAHNNFIELLCDVGIIGFLLYYAMYIRAARELYKQKGVAIGCITALFLIRLFGEYAMVTYYDKMQWIMMAIFMLPCEKERKEISEVAQNV